MAACGIGFHKTHQCRGKALCLDLSLAWAQSMALDLISCDLSLAIAWITPPSGTLSRARDRPIKAAWAAAGVPAAPTLRSALCPEGLAGALKDPRLGAQIRSANILVHFAFAIITKCVDLGRHWYVTNPVNTYLWDFEQWTNLQFEDVDIELCAYGGPRPNPLRIRCCNDWLSHLRTKCPGDHVHTPWRPAFVDGRFKGFGDAQARGVPPALANEISKALMRGSRSPPADPSGLAGAAIVMAKAAAAGHDENKRRVAKANAAANWQARGRRMDQVVPEYREVVALRLSESDCAGLNRRMRLANARTFGSRRIPKDTQVLSISSGGGLHGKREVVLGIPWTPLEFFVEARKVRHPFSGLAAPKTVAVAVFECVTRGPTAIRLAREAFFKHWESVAKDLERKEEELVATLHEDVRPFAAKKRPLLTHALLKAAGFSAADLVFEVLTKGAPMFGCFPATGVFPRRLHEATVTVDQLPKAAKWALPALLGSGSATIDCEAQKALWEKTMEEVERREARGPFTAEQLDKRHPQGWIAARRFGVPQKGSWRAVDDYRISNASSSTEETVDTDGPDEIVGTGKFWSQAMASKTFRLRLDDGTILEGTRHAELDDEAARALLARIIDLERAYKQLARPAWEAHLAVFALLTEGGEWRFFEGLALGFGARNAVFGFSLPARAIRFLLNVCLFIPATHFFDDFSHLDALPFSEDSCRCVERLLSLLGWAYKKEPEDLKPAAGSFAPLGVSIDFSTPGLAVVSNTEKRKQKIRDESERLCNLEEIPAPAVQSLVGVCQYSEAQTSGRTGALSLRAVRRAAGRSDSAKCEELRTAIAQLAEHVDAARPRSIPLTRADDPIVLLTDAAFDGGLATFGAVMFDPKNGTFEFFGGKFSAETVKYWQRDGALENCEEPKAKEQIIAQAELAVVPMAFTSWRTQLQNREILVFVDNEPAKDALINGISSSWASAAMVRETRRLSASGAMAPWYDRVASPSNLADDPSRGHFVRLVKLGASRVEALGLPSLSILIE